MIDEVGRLFDGAAAIVVSACHDELGAFLAKFLEPNVPVLTESPGITRSVAGRRLNGWCR